ncbi:MAG: hypothetical protein DI629_20465 [Mesorhizobium amorphae]|nr:MAG: hypothetical protein DI629_20465 [Mesorhizobium amorphae]
MRVKVDWDNELDGDLAEIGPAEVELFGVAPFLIEDGHVAHYDLPSARTERELGAEIENASWCHRGYEFGEDPGPEPF